jgi:hypothetical protein
VNAKGLDETRSMVENAGLSATFVVADVTNQADIDRLVVEAGSPIQPPRQRRGHRRRVE